MTPEKNLLLDQLAALRLAYLGEHAQSLADEAAREHWTHLDFLSRLIEGETHRRQDAQMARRIAAAHFPALKTLEQFHWTWPKKINRAQIQNLFRLAFLENHSNVILMGGVGLGKTHLATALAHAACLQGHATLFTSAVEVINHLSEAQTNHRLKTELKKYLAPRVLVLDEIGYLPIDKHGADLLFQVISGRYEKGSTILTTNKAFKQWPSIFNNDSTLASAVLDRLLHHAETVVIEGKSYRMKDQVQEC
jgi:DNA replication protein DnaC